MSMTACSRKLADHMDVPVLRKSSEAPAIVPDAQKPQDAPAPPPHPAPAARAPSAPAVKKPAPAAIARRTVLESFSVDFPGYLIDAIKRDALDRHTTARYVVLLALRAAGFQIDEADMVPDARRRSRKTGDS